MKSNMKRLLRTMEVARPASGNRPQTESEWLRLKASAIECFGAHLQSADGLGPNEARLIAYLAFRGQLGRLLLEMAYSEERE
jgi:hypothetical protein